LRVFNVHLLHLSPNLFLVVVFDAIERVETRSRRLDCWRVIVAITSAEETLPFRIIANLLRAESGL
jgi:hypothetical protein